MQSRGIQGGVVVKCDQLSSKSSRRYLILQGSTLWVSKQPVFLGDEAYKQHLTGGEQYVMVRMDTDSSVDCPHSHTIPAFLLVSGTLARDTSCKITLSLSFMNVTELNYWKSALETSQKYYSIQRENGTYERLLNLAARMHAVIPVMDRFYHLIRYRKCFLGSEAVLWLIHDQKCSMEEAKAMGNDMIDLGFFYHVSHEHFLCNSYLFYRFNGVALAKSDFFELRDTNTSVFRLGNPLKLMPSRYLNVSSSEGNHSGDGSREGSDDEDDSVDEQVRAEQCVSLPLLHAVEDLEIENTALKNRLLRLAAADENQRCLIGMLEDSVASLESIEHSAVLGIRYVTVLLFAGAILSPCLFIFSKMAFALLIFHILGAEALTRVPSRQLYVAFMKVMSFCGVAEAVFDRFFPSKALRAGMQKNLVEPLSAPISHTTHACDEDSLSGSPIDEINRSNPSTDNARLSDDYDDMIVRMSNSTFVAPKLVDVESSLSIPHFSEWPNFPLLVRRSPDMFRNSNDASVPIPSEMLQPLRIHQHPPEMSVFPIDNHLFKGRVFVIVAGLDDSPVDFFSKRNRLFEVVVQGRFKQTTPYSSVYNGQVFKKPFQSLPPKWMMRILIGLLSKIQPGLQVSLNGSHPYMVSSLIAASKNVVVSLPGDEPKICVTNESGTDAVKENMSLLVDSPASVRNAKGKNDANAILSSRSASKRAHFFSDMKNLSQFSYSPDHVYTFDFYQHVLNIGQMKLDLGFTSLDVSSIIGFSPVQIMAVQWDPHNEPDLESIEYFYNIEMWNRKSFPSDFFDNNDEHDVKIS